MLDSFIRVAQYGLGPIGSAMARHVVERDGIKLVALDEMEDGDTILIFGKPDLEVRLRGTNGDIATVAIAVNAVHRVYEAPPGLITMRDLPIVTIW